MASEKYRIFDKMIEGIQIVNSDYQYVYVNNTVAIHGKYSREELLGQRMIEKYPGIEATEMFSFIKKCMNEQVAHQMVNEFDFPDGSKGYFELRMQPVPEGILILSFDITKQKQAEQLLLNTNAMLDEKVKQRTSELTAKNKELEQFAYIASHDLQEPLRTVSNYIGVFKEDYSERLDNTALGYLNSMNRATERMSTLTKALLDFSRLGRDRKLSFVNCSELIKDVIADLENMIRSSGAIITIGKMPEVNVYETEMRQVFQNLITNAIKFRHKDIKPEINIYSQRIGNKWKFSVTDNGIGIEQEHFERIFHIFQKLHPNDKYEGNGIGLANCKKIVEIHEGEISVESISGKGSTFGFTISRL
ncbi:MAG TPA: ATP-binding protein [Cytophagaceae bacterium]|jgi:PAS domain S-box-containing protein|nr:ATP-binding protein [Cytophagaceae bacterium]